MSTKKSDQFQGEYGNDKLMGSWAYQLVFENICIYKRVKPTTTPIKEWRLVAHCEEISNGTNSQEENINKKNNH